jgi:hypothetical protein
VSDTKRAIVFWEERYKEESYWLGKMMGSRQIRFKVRGRVMVLKRRDQLLPRRSSGVSIY